jgi:hypothetical protein
MESELVQTAGYEAADTGGRLSNINLCVEMHGIFPKAILNSLMKLLEEMPSRLGSIVYI